MSLTAAASTMFRKIRLQKSRHSKWYLISLLAQGRTDLLCSLFSIKERPRLNDCSACLSSLVYLYRWTWSNCGMAPVCIPLQLWWPALFTLISIPNYSQCTKHASFQKNEILKQYIIECFTLFQVDTLLPQKQGNTEVHPCSHFDLWLIAATVFNKYLLSISRVRTWAVRWGCKRWIRQLLRSKSFL